MLIVVVPEQFPTYKQYYAPSTESLVGFLRQYVVQCVQHLICNLNEKVSNCADFVRVGLSEYAMLTFMLPMSELSRNNLDFTCIHEEIDILTNCIYQI